MIPLPEMVWPDDWLNTSRLSRAFNAIIIPPASHDVIIHHIEAETEAQASASHNAATRERTPRHNSVRVGF